ncbi:hypothetical protein J6590_089599 [Homalodisca vitripennis]|nr:hypothetical protein J6590_089599 [Homalodisca vitripennis]
MIDKSILNQALNDLYFFVRYPHLKERCHLVWLLFFDLYKRDFALRDPLDPDVEAAFASQGLHEVDETLWQLRVKLAATVSRLRIKSGAHSLSKLLPRHLRLTRTALEENIVTGWINIFKTNLNDTNYSLKDLGIDPLPRDRDLLEPSTYKTDHLLPRFLHIMPSLREDLVESTLVKENHIIMQERTFCLGPAVVAQLLKDFSLSGKVAQTHVNSPITTAYLANLLVNNDKIEALLVFGAGYRKEACEQYLRELGVKNTRVYSESFASLSPESRVLDNVIAVLATPPNTNSSVTDPVDLAVARGGDLQILQQMLRKRQPVMLGSIVVPASCLIKLTDDDFASTPRGDHINKFLVDQRDTLRRAMSKPQIQFVVYETHSRFTCENEEMVNTLVTDLNNYAAEVHLEELRRAQGESQEKERGPGEPSAEAQGEVPVVKIEDELSLPIPPLQTVVKVVMIKTVKGFAAIEKRSSSSLASS